nr:hypothetical protein [Tanacetum cinerariifolium]
MANLTFADSHNTVAYMEKLAENADFAKIVDFLNANPIRKTKRKVTEISQSSGPTTLVADKTLYEERGDRVERAATTAASLDAEQNSENNKTAQNLEFTHLKKRVKRLEKKRKLRTPQLKRSINITTTEPVTTINAPITTVGVSVSTAKPSTPLTIKTIIEDEDLIIAQTLMKIRSEKSKVKAKERGSKDKFGETATRQTSRVIMREAMKDRAKRSETRAKGSSKRVGEELESDKSKKQKLDEKVEAGVDNDQKEA